MAGRSRRWAGTWPATPNRGQSLGPATVASHSPTTSLSHSDTSLSHTVTFHRLTPWCLGGLIVRTHTCQLTVTMWHVNDCVTCDVQVFEAVVAWINYDKSGCRREVIAQLMQHVRLPLLSQDFLVQRVEQEPLIKNNSACKDLLIEALKYHLLRPEQKIHFASPRTKQRSPAGLPKVWCSYVTCWMDEIEHTVS